MIGFIGNEVAARYRIRVGRKIGSAALVADGYHARTDAFTSLAVDGGGLRISDPAPGCSPPRSGPSGVSQGGHDTY